MPPAEDQCFPGMTPEDYLEPMPEIWPENARTVEVFEALDTQWARGWNGRPTGLRYEALPAVLDFLEVPAAERRELFLGLQVMEAAGLAAMQE